MKIVALVPARAGSKRIPGKNSKLLGQHTLVEWTLIAAKEAGIFSDVLLCTDDQAVVRTTRIGGIGVWWREHVPDGQRDIEWVMPALASFRQRPHAFAILRPTSPFRTAKNIRDAWSQLRQCADIVDSIRAVRPVTEHPGKMWVGVDDLTCMKPFMEGHIDGTPYHSCPTQALPKIYVQTSSLEIGWTSNVEVHGTISGRKVIPFFHEDPLEGLSLDTPDDWLVAEHYAHRLAARQTTAATD